MEDEHAMMDGSISWEVVEQLSGYLLNRNDNVYSLYQCKYTLRKCVALLYYHVPIVALRARPKSLDHLGRVILIQLGLRGRSSRTSPGTNAIDLR